MARTDALWNHRRPEPQPGGAKQPGPGRLSAAVGGVYRLNADGTVPSNNPSRRRSIRISTAGMPTASATAMASRSIRSTATSGTPRTARMNTTRSTSSSPGFNSGWNTDHGARCARSARRRRPRRASRFHLQRSRVLVPRPSRSPASPFWPTRSSMPTTGRVARRRRKNGNLYLFRLNVARDGFVLSGGLADLVADNTRNETPCVSARIRRGHRHPDRPRRRRIRDEFRQRDDLPDRPGAALQLAMLVVGSLAVIGASYARRR